MTGIITDDMKRLLLDSLIEKVAGDSDSFYVAIGRSEDWNDSDVPTTPYNRHSDILDFRHRMQSVKIAEDVTYTIPRTNWTSGTIYSAYDNTSIGHPTTPYFVLTDEYQVYACVERSRNSDGTIRASTVKPTGTSTSVFQTADGYTWKFMYGLITTDTTKFLSANFMPVDFIDSDEAVSAVNKAIQKTIQDAAVPGEVLNIEITNGGSGYDSSAPYVSISGDGSGATATASVYGGQVTRIVMDTRGSGYTYVDVSLDSGSGSGATARGIVPASPNGFGSNAKIDLKAKAVMFNCKPDGLEGGDFIVGNDFRQIALLRNPKKPNSDSDYTAASGSTLTTIRLSSTAEADTFSVDQTITGATTSAQAVIDYIDSDTLFIHQNGTTGFVAFDSAESVTAPSASGTIIAYNTAPDVDRYSGEIVYLENRAAVTRAENQSEDIKIIIQL